MVLDAVKINLLDNTCIADPIVGRRKLKRKPPSTGRFVANDTITVYGFQKSEGSVSNTFIARKVARVPIKLRLRNGGIIDAVRYGRDYRAIYKPETFETNSKQWVGDGDILRDHDTTLLKLPLKHLYFFECDDPISHYE